MDAPKDESIVAKSEVVLSESIEEDFEDEPDETFGERLIGLTEMLPDSVRNLSENVFTITERSVISLYQFACSASWIFFTSSMILFAPVIFETERAQMEQMQKSQQNQMLLGPGSQGMAGLAPPMPR
ncbi:mitochondrial import receptor subunit TOM22 homolog [Chironomus tepperi]|uniref:mitochondrial import receptor subunit TOM22 homolog n=1 Tax=Chironomus tepperi TaxID=113505 RepID=UPI00391F6B7A